MSAPEGNTAIRLYEAKFRDAITAVLSAAIRPDRPVETTLAEALRKLFLCYRRQTRRVRHRRWPRRALIRA